MTTVLPDFKKGIDYWTAVDATVDGVLGGFGEGPLPRVEQLSSRLFLLSLLPQLQSFSSPLSAPTHQALTSTRIKSNRKRYTALDVGAGVGRVTKNTLLPLMDDVITAEPVEHFIKTARREALNGEWTFLEDRSSNAVSKTSRQAPPPSSSSSKSKNKPAVSASSDEEPDSPKYDKLGNIIPSTSSSSGSVNKGKRVWFVQASLNDLDPARPLDGKDAKSLGVVGGSGPDEEFGERAQADISYDVIWCQWCLGHLSNPALIIFLKRCQQSIHLPSQITLDVDGDSVDYRDPGGVIVVKENVCEDGPGGTATIVLDEEDSSLTRSNKMWEEIFEQAGLKIVKEEVQLGLPNGLFMVKSWALR